MAKPRRQAMTVRGAESADEFHPSEEEYRLLRAALDEDIAHPDRARPWSEVRAEWADADLIADSRSSP